MNEWNELSESEEEVIRKSFITELQDLCEKYNVTLEADDHWTGYAECGSDVRIEACFENWQIDDIDFGDWIDGKRYSANRTERVKHGKEIEG